MTIKKKQPSKIIVALSGGIDSFFSLILLKEQGYQPVGVSFFLPFFALTQEEEKRILKERQNTFLKMKKLCQKLKVDYYLIDLRKDFEEKVVSYFIEGYKKGLTPNPCVYCNRYFKFEYLMKTAKQMKINLVATGHYARLRLNQQNKKYELLMAKDKSKDQTYHLCFLSQNILKRVVFPLGGYRKKEVFELLRGYLGEDYLNYFASYRESQNFCYLNNHSEEDLLSFQLGKNKIGLIVEVETHKILGEHLGYYLYTLGQRRGLKLAGGPFYVVKIDKKNNIVYVSKNKKNLFKKEFLIGKYHLISGERIKKPIIASVKIRSTSELIKAKVSPLQKGLKITTLKKSFLSPTPGQIAAFYQEEKCLGGGIII